MQTSADVRSSASAQAVALRRDAWRGALPCLAWMALMSAGAMAGAGFGPWFAVRAFGVFGLAFVLLLRALPAHAPHARFGSANRLTLARLALVALLAAGVGERLDDPVAMAWIVIAVAATAALMDALDGPLARTQGLASDFGARFDMETDALLVLVLSLLVIHFGKAGAWILAAGLMRYAFVLLAFFVPWLAHPLPPSQRRKSICVVQIASLIACLVPIVTRPWSDAMAAAGLAALTVSFGTDLAWLACQRRRATSTHRRKRPEPAP
ncbi:CDP-alcohol phosphatidyltransferase family protein [Variovorax saccharolyticus]|uniref:CDP-alcohol phosphatidyltransferase family protein n=1 Tax=Variovorax saccharolyticus TaxID=3053516 RepID=UPI002576145F|nr:MULTISPECIES: CDP-alcohol phosphatidyltransferase family protein [unclassified Variovorax]MDM0016137.1 CDP-alcohol phosphatidyltransferase family protein [Variovorax sp. J22R187]MDM0027062.1 CDP-alcohol phosphatidyltransferase family protein [Variovorax sp. J31P216]